MLSLSSTRNFFMLAMILGFLFIMGTKAKAADVYKIYESERAPIRNHMMPQNFNRNNRDISNEQWRSVNSVYRSSSNPYNYNPRIWKPLSWIPTGVFTGADNTYTAPTYYGSSSYYGSPSYTYSAPTVTYQSPAYTDNAVRYNDSQYLIPGTTTTEYSEIRNHMMPENFNRNDRSMDNQEWVRNNTVVR